MLLNLDELYKVTRSKSIFVCVVYERELNQPVLGCASGQSAVGWGEQQVIDRLEHAGYSVAAAPGRKS